MPKGSKKMPNEDNPMYDQLMLFTGGIDVTPVDISADLPRQTEQSYKKRDLSAIQLIVIHTTDWDTTPQELAAYDIRPFTMYKGEKIWNHISKKGCPAITYHEIAMKDKLYKTLDWEEESWHAGKWNKQSIAIAMMYKCTKDGEDQLEPPDNMLKIVQTRCGDICLELGLTPDVVKGHRELEGTGWFWEKGSRRLRKTCPGKKVDLDLLRKNVAMYMQVKLLMAGLYKGKIDGDFGPKSKAALEAYRVQE